MKMKVVISLFGMMGFMATAHADVKEYKELTEASQINMKQAMDIATGRAKGAVVKAELDREDDKPVYEIEVLSGESLYEFKIDAATSNIIATKEDKD